jgi:hypothetical protein
MKKKMTVLYNKSGKVESVAMLNPAPSGRFHIEVEGGGSVEELEVDEKEVERGEKKIFEKLQRVQEDAAKRPRKGEK